LGWSLQKAKFDSEEQGHLAGFQRSGLIIFLLKTDDSLDMGHKGNKKCFDLIIGKADNG
jgi:hypothetical protein